MTTQPDQWMSFDDYLEFEDEAERKHEYDDGYLTAMAGATARHVTITQNLVAVLRPHLRGTPCRAYSTDMKLRPIRTKGYYPDVFVTCDERDRGEEVVKHYPKLAIEVLSESTEKRDRGIKWAGYRRCETLEDYVLVSQYRQSVEIFSRAGDVWVYRAYGPEDTVPFTSIDLSLSMDALYEDVEWRPSQG
jgi:Uma2 family endonuclease